MPEPGTTYYGEPQLKPSPFSWIVALYIFLAGLSGSSQLIATIADLCGGKRNASIVRRGRYAALLGALTGPVLLIIDLHTPQRFYNMLRIFKPTSPMSIGSYILSCFGLFSVLTAGAQFLIDRGVKGAWRRVARAAQVPAATAGAGMSVYTAALMSATSTPLWAAAPRALAVEFGSASVGSAASLLALGERRAGGWRSARKLDALALAALAAELAAASAGRKQCEAAGAVLPAQTEAWAALEGLGMALPAALYGASLLAGRSGRGLANAAGWLACAGSLALRLGFLYAGNATARDPDVSLRFAQPENLPAKRQ